MRVASLIAAACLGLLLCGCEGDYQGQPGQKPVEIKQTPDLDPRTDHDIDVNTPDVDIDVKREPGKLPDVDVNILKTPDKDTKANQP
jgi:hypothetical protein